MELLSGLMGNSSKIEPNTIATEVAPVLAPASAAYVAR